MRVGSAAGDRCLEHLVEAEAIGQRGQGIDARRACDGLFAFQRGDPAVCLPQQHRKQDTGERQRHEKDDHHRNGDTAGSWCRIDRENAGVIAPTSSRPAGTTSLILSTDVLPCRRCR